MTAIFRILRNTRGVTMVEYAIMVALIAALCIGAVGGLGSKVNKAFKDVATCPGNGGGFACSGTGNGNGGNGNGNGNGGTGNGNGNGNKP